MSAHDVSPTHRVTVKISKASLKSAQEGHDTARLLRENFETRRAAIQRFTDRLRKTRGVAEPAWTAALRDLGIDDSEIEKLVEHAQAGSGPNS